MNNHRDIAEIDRLPVSDKADKLNEQLRQIPLRERLKNIKDRIAKMCSQGRPPRMCIPVQFDDDDWFINRTIEDALAALDANSAPGMTPEEAKERARSIRLGNACLCGTYKEDSVCE